MVNYKNLVLKAITKRNAVADTKWPLSVENLIVFGHFEVHFGHMRVAKMVNYQKVSPKGNYKEKCLG